MIKDLKERFNEYGNNSVYFIIYIIFRQFFWFFSILYISLYISLSHIFYWLEEFVSVFLFAFSAFIVGVVLIEDEWQVSNKTKKTTFEKFFVRPVIWFGWGVFLIFIMAVLVIAILELIGFLHS